MNPQEEAKDLIRNPLPAVADVYTSCPSGEVLQNIAYLTETISDEEARIDYLKRQLEQLKSRAIAEDIKESSGFFVLEVPGKKMRNPIQDIDTFKARFPDGYRLVRAQQATDILDKFTRDTKALDTAPIPLTLADAKVGKDQVTEFVGYQPQKVSIEVRKKQDWQRQIG